MSFTPIVVFVGRIEIGKEVVEMECEKRHVGTHRLAKACTHCKIFVVNIVVYTSEHDALTTDFLLALCKADVIIGFCPVLRLNRRLKRIESFSIV